ncbi:MAG: ATP-binding cassette domain-containing protein [Candidatus Cloacimonas sp.]|jgi:phospholipid/cholesterol/gamma-HCH transport system ATP-binding protein|nr:ATP-binding cassette domain-containing protein [Candidatus Cloacimonas sp.]
MIQVKDLCVSLNGKQILKDISFDLQEGQNLAILGRSGSGKTVLIKSLLGIYMPDSGEVIIDGIDIHRGDQKACQDLKMRFAMVFQNAALLDSFTVLQNVALPLYERGSGDSDEIQKKVIESLKTVGLEHTLDLYPAQLSGGMRKRIGIARALVYSPDYIIFDEPVSGLDPITAGEVLFYISRIKNGIVSKVNNKDTIAKVHVAAATQTSVATLITITHEIRNLDQIADRVLFLDNGSVLFSGSVPELQHSTNEFIKRYLA